MNRGLLFPGSWGMGIAVRDADGRPGACLSLACIESRMQGEREPELARLLAEEGASWSASSRPSAPLRSQAPPPAARPSPAPRRRGALILIPTGALR
jgi:hypothetical protein